MNDNKFSGLLGLCRKANKMSVGHDAAKISVTSGNAVICIIASDASERLKKEFASLCKQHEGKTEIIMPEVSIADFGLAIGTKAGVITINDDGFAKMLRQYWEDNR